MSVESATTVETLPGVQVEVQEYAIQPCFDAQAEMEMAIALGVQAVKKSAKERAARIEEVRAHLAAGTYSQDSMAIAQKMLETE